MVLSAGILFCLLAALLLWVIIGGKGHWLVKLLLIVPTIWFSLAVSYSLPTMLGWPSEAELPAKYEVIGVKVENPNLKTGYPGRILVWAIDMDPKNTKYRWSLYKPDKESPRVHEIPYSKRMHKMAQRAQMLLRKGKRVMGSNGKGARGKGKKGRGQGRKGRGGTTGTRGS